MTYANTSALVTLLIAETETPDLAAYLSTAPDRTTSSELTIAGLTRTVARAGADAASAGLLCPEAFERRGANSPPIEASPARATLDARAGLSAKTAMRRKQSIVMSGAGGH